MEKILEEMKKGTLQIVTVERKEKKVFPPLLYDLTQLQRDANQRYGFSAKETLNLMQRLYENHKVLTYPRTDSKYITSDVAGTIGERLDACAIGPYKKLGMQIKNKKWNTENFVNDKKVTDHHAIIPTEL